MVLVVKAMVGLGLILQQTPLEVMAAPPSLVMLPPLLALIAVIADKAVVLMVGKTTDKVEKLSWLPYAVPVDLVAYART